MKPNSYEAFQKRRDRLNKKKERLDKALMELERKEARQTTSERKKETRRKILIGAYYLNKARHDNTLNELAKLMDSFLDRDYDRSLFDLPPLKKESPGENRNGQH